MRTRSAALLLVLATALPRLVALLHERDRITLLNVDKGDVFARQFLGDGTYGFIPGHPSAYTQPLYGWFLIPLYWAHGHHWEVVGPAHIVVACGTVLIVWQIGARWLSPAIGVLAGLAVAVHPYLIWHDVHMNREILDQFLAAAAVYLTLLAAERFTWKRGAALGVVLGLGILGNVRLEALPLLLLAYLLVRRRGIWIGALAVLAAAAVVVMPWVIRNRADVGCWAVTTDARALWKANNLNTYATLQSGQWIDHVPQPKSFPPTPQDVYDHWLQTGVVLPYDECAQMTEFQSKVISFWVHHPGAKAKIMPIDAQWLWQPQVVGVTDRPGQGTWLDTMRFYAEPAYMIVLYVLGAIGLFLVPRYFAALVVLLLGYQTLVAMLFVGETRYRVPWDFLIALCAATTVIRGVERRYPRAFDGSRDVSRASDVQHAERRGQRDAPRRHEQVVVVEVRVDVLRERPEHGAGEPAERVGRRQHAGRRQPAAHRAIDETELLHDRTHTVVGVPAPAAEPARLDAASTHPLGVAANALRRIAAGRPRMRRARPVRVQADALERGSPFQPAAFVLAVLRIRRANERDDRRTAERAEAAPAFVVERPLQVA